MSDEKLVLPWWVKVLRFALRMIVKLLPENQKPVVVTPDEVVPVTPMTPEEVKERTGVQ